MNKKTSSVAIVTTVMLLLSNCGPNKETDIQEELGFEHPRTVKDDPKPGYLTNEESLAAFRLPKGYHLELVADETMLNEPVALSWDGDGKMYVTQMETYMI